jgi:hypothetical protein
MRWGCKGVNEGASSWQLRGNSWIRDDVSKPGSHSPRTSPRARSPQTSSRVSVFPPSYSRNEVIPELKKGGITSFLLFEFHALWSRRWPTICVCLSQHRDAKINGRAGVRCPILCQWGGAGASFFSCFFSWSSLLSVRRVRRHGRGVRHHGCLEQRHDN